MVPVVSLTLEMGACGLSGSFLTRREIAMDIVTYDLCNGRMNSDAYYRDVAVFAADVLAQADQYCGQLIRSCNSILWVEGQGGRQKCVLELLVLGVIWRSYGERAAGMPVLARSLLSCLTSLQLRGFHRQRVGTLAGWLRGCFNRLPSEGYDPDVSLAELRRLAGWLGTVEDFHFEKKIITKWLDYLACQPREQAEAFLRQILSFSYWFEQQAEEALGCYTRYVASFRRDISPARRWKEDYYFCNRAPVEYHLNMVGAELMNGMLREEFLQHAAKTVLLPACMCARQAKVCKALPDELGYRCAGCALECRVNQLTQLGDTFGFTVCIVPHTSSLFQLGKTQVLKSAGVVGVACVTNLLKGGWMLEASGIPAQCVLLDYCGCRMHWHDTGIATDINTGRLKEVMKAE